jgi:hypothetical protein
MATYTITVNEKNSKAKKLITFLLDYAQSNKDISIEEEHIPNAVSLKAIKDAEEGRTHKANSVKELFESIR